MLLLSVLCLFVAPPAPLQDAAVFEPSVWGLELPVSDVAAAERAYRTAFGFESLVSAGEHARLVKDGLALVLVRSNAPRAAAGAANVHLNLEARDLELALEAALAAGFEAPDPEPATIPIGRAVTVLDADGHATNLIDLDERAGAGEEGTRVFNVGLDLETGAERDFVERLGF